MSNSRKFRRETKQEYKEDTEKYFKNISGNHSGSGDTSADDPNLIDEHLPEKKQLEILDRYERGFKKQAHPGIFTEGLKFKMDFIDEMTPGKYKAPEEAKPNPEQQRQPHGFVPKLRFIITDVCLDCMQQPDPKDVCWSNCVITESDTQMLHAMGVRQWDIGLNFQCMDCYRAAQKIGRQAIPLVLVLEGGMIDEKEHIQAYKYRQQIQLHEGREVTLGQWLMTKRQERLNKNLYKYLMIEHLKTNSPVYREYPEDDRRLANVL